MLAYLKRYWKLIFFVFTLVVLFSVGCFAFHEKNTVTVDSVKKMAATKKKTEEKVKTELSTVFVDVKGAVNAPGVYEIDSEKRIIDAINLAGGLTDQADTINLNLSKKVKDEMYIIVYTKTEIYNYKSSNGNNNEIVCASVECVCPDTKNDACIANNSSGSNTSTSSESNASKKDTNSKVSINTADKETLMMLSGIGEAKADAIISYRKEKGSFESIEDIKNVSGIGDALFEKIKDNITV